MKLGRIFLASLRVNNSIAASCRDACELVIAQLPKRKYRAHVKLLRGLPVEPVRKLQDRPRLARSSVIEEFFRSFTQPLSVILFDRTLKGCEELLLPRTAGRVPALPRLPLRVPEWVRHVSVTL